MRLHYLSLTILLITHSNSSLHSPFHALTRPTFIPLLFPLYETPGLFLNSLLSRLAYLRTGYMRLLSPVGDSSSFSLRNSLQVGYCTYLPYNST